MVQETLDKKHALFGIVEDVILLDRLGLLVHQNLALFRLTCVTAQGTGEEESVKRKLHLSLHLSLSELPQMKQLRH